MKNVLLTSLLVAGCVLGMAAMRDPGYSSPLNTKAVKDFRKRFAATDDEKWLDYRAGYAAVFTSDDIRFRVEYDSKGNWSGTEKGYKEIKLDRDIRKIVKQVYFDYAIAYVREFIVPGMSGVPVYVITIEDEDSFKTLAVCEGEIRVTEEFLKKR